jgi:hypothetical protein
MLLQDRLGEILNQAFIGHVAAATLARASAGIEQMVPDAVLREQDRGQGHQAGHARPAN